MTIWYRSVLTAQEAVASANSMLENARNTQDKNQALKFCGDAETQLKRVDIKATEQTMLGQIVATYREHGIVLERWGYSDKALKSNDKASRLEYVIIPLIFF